MEFKGTKDKWGVCSANKTEVNSFNGTAIAECGMSQMASMEERQANAKLIAAAPELLKACQKVLKGGYGCAPSIEYMDILKKGCELAIKKALG